MTRFDLVIVGGGTAGLVAAHIAAAAGGRVALVERDRTGGDCLWTGCVPSKALLAAAQLAQRMRTADAVGLEPVEPDTDLAAVAERIRVAQETIAPYDSRERLEAAGVEVLRGHARFEASGHVAVGGRRLRTRSALVATGSEPIVPPIDGIHGVAIYTSDTIWDGLATIRGPVLVIGGGPTGCELGQGLARLGIEVHLVEMAERLLAGEEPAAGVHVAAALRSDGARLALGTTVERIARSGDALRGQTADGNEIHAANVLVAVGRRPRTDGLGLERIGVRLRPGGAVAVGRTLATTARGVYAAGDVTGTLPFTHVAALHGATAALNALFPLRREISHQAVPWVTFTDPEVARVGITSGQARAAWRSRARTVDLPMERVDRAVTDARTEGFVRLVAGPDGRLRGATVVAPHAGEVIAGLASVVARGGRVRDITATVHPYPTYAMGAYVAATEDLRDRLADDRTRRLTRPLLATLRGIDTVRERLSQAWRRAGS